MGDAADMALEHGVAQEIEIAEANQYGWQDGEYHEFDPPEPIPELDTFGDMDTLISMIKHDSLILSQQRVSEGRTRCFDDSKFRNRIKTMDYLIGMYYFYTKNGYLSEKQWSVIDSNWVGKRQKFVKDILVHGDELVKTFQDHKRALTNYLRP